MDRWGPSHQSDRGGGRSGRRVLEAISGIAVFVVIAVVPAGSRTAVIGGLVVVALLAVAIRLAAGPLRRGLDARRGRRSKAPASGGDPLAAIRASASRAGGGVYLGLTAAGEARHGRPERAVLLLGPPRSGKTSAVIIPAVLAHTGAVVSTSTKPDVARATRLVRALGGRVWMFDPTGTSSAGGPLELRWSPVSSSVSWDGALLMAAR